MNAVPDSTATLSTAAAARINRAALHDRPEGAGHELLDVMTAARAVSENIGTPGATLRRVQLGDALDALMAADPTSAALVAAAIWSDRYGTSGSPARLADLQDAVEALQDATTGTVVESTPEQPLTPQEAAGVELLFEAAERPFDVPEPVRGCAGECSCQTPSAEELEARDAARIAAGPVRTVVETPRLLG